jgi:signal transduction histidine kinase
MVGKPPEKRPSGRLWRAAGPVVILLAALAIVAVMLQVLGPAYLLVFAMNVSMVTLVLTLIIYRRYHDWRVLPLALLFFWNTFQQTLCSATDILGLRAPAWVTWLADAPLVVPTLLGFAAVVYLWRVFQVQADLQQREQALAERLRQAQHLESLGAMAGGVAHDFNNILTTIVGNTALILLDAPKGSEMAAAARSIQQAADRATAVSRQMLDYSGCGKFRPERLDLARLAESLQPRLRASLPDRVRLLVEAAPEPAPEVVADCSQIQQVLVNLVANAAEATPGAGTVTLRTSAVSADEALLATGVNTTALAPGLYAVLEVEDTGAGMDENTRQRLFEPFFSTRAVGRGMGLAAVLGIVRGHHGTIRVQTAPGKGTRLQVLLPAARDGEAPAVTTASPRQYELRPPQPGAET